MTPLSSLALEYQYVSIDQSVVINADCFEWMKRIPENSIHGIVTDPPYGVKEYENDQLEKRANGNGGIWRIPPAFGGCVRQPLPRFTALNVKERKQLSEFFTEWAKAAVHALRPGGHIFIATILFYANQSIAPWLLAALNFGGN